MSDVCVVGDAFHKLSNKKNIFTVSDFIQGGVIDDGCDFVFGQGLTLLDIKRLGKIEKFNTELSKINPVRCHDTHQHNSRNVLISNFRLADSLESCSDVFIFGDNDLLRDHITGIHIPGIVLSESARQLFITTLMSAGYDNYRFILNDIVSEYISYVFPLPFTLSLVFEYEKNLKNEKIISAHIIASQNMTECARFNIRATLIPEKIATLNEVFSFKKMN
ncbi:hypothetical protein [Lonsdalea quercina]|uniref:hypothetical protein n=1 Tax=Lonsdalea quercina TaxID=71657 RepID=UPI0039766AF8